MTSDNGNIAGSPRTAGAGRGRLRAVVSVDVNDRVQCQQPGCGHTVYAAIHVVEEDGRLLVLGSTCFAKRYGSAHALGQAQYGGGGGGRTLTEEERRMLVQNTEALLAHFEAQDLAEAAAAAAALAAKQARAQELHDKQHRVEERRKLQAVYEQHQAAPVRAFGPPGLAPPPSSPWPWQLERTSVALFTAPDGAHWVRVQHRDGSQKLVPWPQFQGWEHALPAGVGGPDTSVGGAIAVTNIVEAIRILQRHGYQGPAVGRWQDVLPRRSSR